MRNKFWSLLLVMAAVITPAWGQKYASQPPVQTFGQFSPSRPMASYQCSQSQANLGTPEVQFFDLSMGGNQAATRGYVDCNGNVIASGRVTHLVPAQLLEFNHASTLTAVHLAGQVVTFSGTIPNCATANALIGAWGTTTGFATSGNNALWGPVLSCSATTLSVPVGANNPANETHAGTFTNNGFQLAAPVSQPTWAGTIWPVSVVGHIRHNTTGYTLGNANNAFSFRYSGGLGADQWAGTITIPLNSFLTVNSALMKSTTGFNITTPSDASNQALLVVLTGTTPALTGGDTSIDLALNYFWIENGVPGLY